MNNVRLIFRRMVYGWLLPVPLILGLLGQAACSSVTNTIAGLTTPQSTISGSNYVFPVQPSNGRLVTNLAKTAEGGEPINAGDYFKVSLDFGFLRYLQAVDPYVIVYSETWMGKGPRPVESEKTHRQVVLLKEGLAPNARLPITSIALLGPVTMGEDLLDVQVTIKVVVLSKEANKQTIQLVEGLAGMASGAAPQYAPIAGAAAATVSAFIAQNRDKVEFEHTFAFSPEATASGVGLLGPHASRFPLREGQTMIIKGESRFRSIPYPSWYYYLWPFNWFGLSPDLASRRYEMDEEPKYTVWGEIVRAPASAVSTFFQDSRGDTGLIGKLIQFPFELIGLIEDDQRGRPPTELAVDGYLLVKCPLPPSHRFPYYVRGFLMKPITFPWELIKEQFSAGDGDKSKTEPGKGLSEDKHCALSGGDKNSEDPHDWTNMYSEKTHIAVSIQKTKGTLGTFSELVGIFSEHAAAIGQVSTSSSAARQLQLGAITSAFDNAKLAVLYERAKHQLRDNAKKGLATVIDEDYWKANGLDALPLSDKRALVQLTIAAQGAYAATLYKAYAREKFGHATTDEAKIAAFKDLVAYIQARQRKHEYPQEYQEMWNREWQRVMDEMKDEVWGFGCSTNNNCFDNDAWKDAEDLYLFTNAAPSG